jgi:alpha-L-rhamnosidase
MSKYFRAPLFVILLTSALAAASAPTPKPYTGKGLMPSGLRCEFRVDPLGLDETEPRLSWIVESGERGQKQSVSRILVASSEKLLAADHGDLWDTGKIIGDETVGRE